MKKKLLLNIYLCVLAAVMLADVLGDNLLMGMYAFAIATVLFSIGLLFLELTNNEKAHQ